MNYEILVWNIIVFIRMNLLFLLYRFKTPGENLVMATDIIFLENLFEKTEIAKINVLLDNLYKIFIMEQMYPEVKCD